MYKKHTAELGKGVGVWEPITNLRAPTTRLCPALGQPPYLYIMPKTTSWSTEQGFLQWQMFHKAGAQMAACVSAGTDTVQGQSLLP